MGFSVRAACGLLVLGLSCLEMGARAQTSGPVPDVRALSTKIREAIRAEYAAPPQLMYIERRREIDISKLGKVSVGPLRTFEVYPDPSGDTWKRLVAVDGKPLDPDELARRDAEHARDKAKQRSETPRQRAARLKKEQEEIRERDALLDDAHAVYELGFICREMYGGDAVLVFSLTPRPEARVTTREGGYMKEFAGRLWISEADYSIARIRLQAVDDVAIGWGVVARVDPGSGFDYARKRIGRLWAPSELTLEASGRTLLFRRFQVKTVTTYSDHRFYQDGGTGSQE